MISVIATPKDCAKCHQEITDEFQASHHAKGGQILGSLDNVLGEHVEGAAAAVGGCKQCHGSFVKLATDEAGAVIRDKDGKPQLDPSTWPNTGIGRVNLDGSLGSCSACHSRHAFSKKVARRPENCGKCHMGPDHPQIEIFNESKHGIAFHANIQEMKLDSDSWVLGKDYSAAPTCATCHMSATTKLKLTHDPGKRISWTLRPVISKKMEGWETKRADMQSVCRNCHATEFVGNFYKQYDEAVNLYNEKFAKPAQDMMKVLSEQKLITPTQFDEEVEFTFYELWHHEGRRARMGASMMGPDYTQWHGFYDVAKTFYTHFVPQIEAFAEKNAAVKTKLEEILAQPWHAWRKGMSKEEMDKIKAYYEKRYGKGGG